MEYKLDKADWGGAENFDNLLREIRQRAPEFAAQNFVSDDIVQRFKKMGIYRAFVPKAFGGDERSPIDFLLAIEEISKADGSAGWVASFGVCESYLGGLPMKTLEKIWANPDDIFAGAMFPIQPAKVVDGGYLLNGRWKWASGCMSADRIGVGIKTDAKNALPSMVVLDADQVTIDKETWKMQGMSGSGSFDVVVDNVIGSPDYTFLRGGKLTPEGSFFQFPTLCIAGQVLAVTSLGVARAAMDIVINRAAARSSATGAPNLGDRVYVQLEMAKAEAKLRSSRLFFYNSIERAWDLLESGKPLDAETVNMMRLSNTHLTRECAEVTRTAYHLSGMEAAENDNHLSRCFRDVHMPTQHAFMGEFTYQNAGAIMFGKKPFPGHLPSWVKVEPIEVKQKSLALV